MSVREKVIALFETGFMRAEIRGLYDELSTKDIADIVKGSRATIREKHDIYAALAEEDDFYIPYRDACEFALAHLDPDPFNCGKSVSYMTEWYCMSDDRQAPQAQICEGSSSCAPTFEQAMKNMARTRNEDLYWLAEVTDPWDTGFWAEITKFIFNEDGNSTALIVYWCDALGTPRYFKLADGIRRGTFQVEEWGGDAPNCFVTYEFWHDRAHMPALDLDLQTSDLFSVESMPYSRRQVGLVLNRQEEDGIRYLLADENGCVYDDVLNDALNNNYMTISPLYGLDVFHFQVDAPWVDLCDYCYEHPYAYSVYKEFFLDETAHSGHIGKLPSVSRKALLVLLSGIAPEHPLYRIKKKTSLIDSLACFLEFIDSEETRERCKEAGWVPTPLEAAYLVWQSETHTVLERRHAWVWLIENAPDVEIPDSWHSRIKPKLHRHLVHCYRLETELFVKLLCAQDYCNNGPSSNYVTLSIDYEDSNGNAALLESPPRKSLSDALEWLGEQLKAIPRKQVKSYTITRKPLDDSYVELSARVTPGFDPIAFSFDPCMMFDGDALEAWQAFDHMSLEKILPFGTEDAPLPLPL